MRLFRKLYDAAPPTETTPSIASIMATSGALNHPSNEGKVPSVTTEKKEEPQQPTANQPAATAEPAPKAEGTPASPAPPVEAKPEAPKKEEPVKTPSWQEVLKQQQPDIIFKELGLDDDTASFLKGRKGIDKKILNLVKHWETNGDVNRYLQEANTDYTKMPAESIMRLQLQREYPKATEKQLDALFKREVVEAYKLNPEAYTAEEADEGRLLLEAKADKYRDQFAKEQQDYLIPKPPEKKDEEAEAQEANRQLFEPVQKSIDNSPFVKELLQNNKITIGEGEEKYNDFPLEHTKEAVDTLLLEIAKGIVVGTIKKEHLSGVNDTYVQNYILRYEFGKNPQAFLAKIGEHFKNIGGKQVIDPIQNASQPGATGTKADAPPTSAAAAMAQKGRITSGGQ